MTSPTTCVPVATFTKPVVPPWLASTFFVTPSIWRSNVPLSLDGSSFLTTSRRGLRLFVIVQSTTSPAASVPSESGPASDDDALLSPRALDRGVVIGQRRARAGELADGRVRADRDVDVSRSSRHRRASAFVVPLTWRSNKPPSVTGTRSLVTFTRGLRLFVITQSTISPAASVPSESGPASDDDALLSPVHAIEDS